MIRKTGGEGTLNISFAIAREVNFPLAVLIGSRNAGHLSGVFVSTTRSKA